MTDETPITSEALSALMDGESNDLDCQRVLKAVKEDESSRDVWRRYHLARTVMRSDVNSETLLMDISSQVRAAIDSEDGSSVAGSAEYEGSEALNTVEDPALSGDEMPREGALGTNEPHKLAPVKQKQWQMLTGKVAIAASVAFVFVLGTQQLSQKPELSALVADRQVAELPIVNTQSPQSLAIRSRSVSTGSTSPRSMQASYSNVQGGAKQQLRYLREAQLQEYVSRLALQHAEQSSFVNGLKAVPYARVGHSLRSQEGGAQQQYRRNKQMTK